MIVGELLFMQLSDLARILALEVFPVPLGPLKRYAGAILLVFNASFKERTIFPIHSFSGRILGFGARSFNPKAKAKYLN